MAVDVSKYKDMFLSEARENLQLLNTSVLALEKKPKDKNTIDAIFRAAHTLKGMAATMGYDDMSELSHKIEDVLSLVRDGKLKVDSKVVSTLFSSVDMLEVQVNMVEKGAEKVDVSHAMDELNQLLPVGGVKKKVEKPAEASGKVKEKAPGKVNAKEEAKAVVEKPLVVPKTKGIRVNVERLDALMNLVEELLVNKMRLDKISEAEKYEDLPTALDSLGRIVSDAQYNVMQARLVPIGQSFTRFPRMVRDLSKEEGKDVDLVMEGSDIELDRSIIDKIGEPLVHLLRNSVDHGIELPEERKVLKKPMVGIVKLSARREKGYAIIEVEDDGRGLDLNEIKEIAIRKGLVAAEDAAELKDEEIISQLFKPGFSINKKVTKSSGRGVGLDVVKSHVEGLGGTVRVESELGKRTKFTLELPLTLAIIKALMIKVGVETYAIPLTNVVRTIKVSDKYIKSIEDNEVIIIGKENIPLVRLHDLFGAPRGAEEGVLVVIVKKGDAFAALAVDSLVDEQDIIIKPLSTILKESKGFAGATILGTGKVALILDIGTLI